MCQIPGSIRYFDGSLLPGFRYPLKPDHVYTRFFANFCYNFKCQILNMLKRDINQQYLKIIDPHFVKSE